MSSHFGPAFHVEKEKHSIAIELEGALLLSRNFFPYFLLIALEAGGPLRALLLLLSYPLSLLFKLILDENVALHMMIFISTAGLMVSDVKAVAKATLPRFFLQELRRSTYEVFAKCGGKKYVVTCLPRVMVEPILREYLDVDHVISTELRVFGGRCLGLVAPPGIMAGSRRFTALMEAHGTDRMIDFGIGAAFTAQPFLSLCLEQHLIPPEENSSPLPRNNYPKPLIFHDGRLVARPGPSDFAIILLWFPLGVLLAIFRILVGLILPSNLGLFGAAATGFRIRAQFPTACHISGPPQVTAAPEKSGTLYVCNHQTLLDPVIISTVLQRKISAVTYSLSRFSELVSPIPTVRLTRDRCKDGAMMRPLLDQGDLVVCPEGTTCREPYLLRFSPLFAEITDVVEPVAVRAYGTMFYGSTVRGHKWLDSFFFLMNPSPAYQLDFLEPVFGCQKSKYDVANHIQRLIGEAIGFKCTNFTRKDKYRMLAGHDGVDTRS
ncbi:glycerol-3-phosphate 2-O-acyltransferase 6-like [Ananas comosus]|uniref:Glycerol-3-phosphate 2-O-acyltransferase 6-like n=1 Tax=Ananas comosus TaxID=4615 RepID=A0A6P5GUW6_ANACO|nr:glycerol-3-phosphate 2-O-acyltransferase 6-like [Ananas comosus]